MLDVGAERGVAVVVDVGVEKADGAAELDGLVDDAFAEADGGWRGGVVAAEEADAGIGIVAAVANPALEKHIAGAQAVGVGG